MSINRAAVRLLTASGLSSFFMLVACDTSEPTASGSDLTTTEAELTATAQSMADAKAAAEACFEAYKTCKAASSADEQACRTALQACLPAEAPRPSRCDAAADASDAGVSTVDAATPPPAPVGDAQAPRGEGDAGRDWQRGEDGDGGSTMHHEQGGHGDRCGAPNIPRDRFGACSAKASSDLAQGSTMPGAADAHCSCMAQGFEERLTQLCEKASALCAEPNAPADICQRITSKCSTIASGNDAGI